MILIHLIITLINSLSMLIIIVEHLLVWFTHVLGGGKPTLLLFVKKRNYEEVSNIKMCF
jgi:hypothetical protein